MSETKKTTSKPAKKTEIKKPVAVKEKKIEKKETAENVEKIEKVEKIEERAADFSGKFVSAIGRRKTATAQVRVYENGKGAILVNGIKASKYFTSDAVSLISQPLKAVGKQRDLNVSVITRGGGKNGQMEAIRHGITRALVKLDPESREVLKVNGWLTRDPREVERKKPGLKKARKAPQWSKR